MYNKGLLSKCLDGVCVFCFPIVYFMVMESFLCRFRLPIHYFLFSTFFQLGRVSICIYVQTNLGLIFGMVRKTKVPVSYLKPPNRLFCMNTFSNKRLDKIGYNDYYFFLVWFYSITYSGSLWKFRSSTIIDFPWCRCQLYS